MNQTQQNTVKIAVLETQMENVEKNTIEIKENQKELAGLVYKYRLSNKFWALTLAAVQSIITLLITHTSADSLLALLK